MLKRILLVDDHEVVRQGVRLILRARPEWRVVDEAEDGTEAIEKAKALRPDLVILDVSMPGTDGLEIIEQLTAIGTHLRVLILTMHQSNELSIRVKLSGASGYVVKTCASRDLLLAIEKTFAGGTFFPQQLSQSNGQNVKSDPHIFSFSRVSVDAAPTNVRETALTEAELTARELEVLREVACGKRNGEIAMLFEISIRTVETHRASIMRKLRFRSSADLIHFAINNGILSA